jgi:hypothetical protein
MSTNTIVICPHCRGYLEETVAKNYLKCPKCDFGMRIIPKVEFDENYNLIRNGETS